MPEEFVVPDEERVAKAVHSDAYFDLVRRFSHQSVVKHFDAYADVDWDNPAYRIDHDDPRWELDPDDVLGATEWYRSQPPEIRSRIGLRMLANFMKIGVIFEYVLKRGLLEFAAQLPTGAPEFRYCYHETIEEAQHSLMFQEFINRTVSRFPGGHARTQECGLGGQVCAQVPGTIFRFRSGRRRSDRFRATPEFAQEAGRHSSAVSANHADPCHRRGPPYQLRASRVAQPRSGAEQRPTRAPGTLRTRNPWRHGQDDDGGVATGRTRIQYPARSRGRRLSQESDSPRAHLRSFDQDVCPVR